jgi:hypothetical protein
MTETIFIKSAKRQFRFYKSMGDKTLERLNGKELRMEPVPESNSIAVIVQHLHGNMLSRWTDFLTSDGEKEWRRRDDEFIDQGFTREVLIEKWEEGWRVLFAALDSLAPADLGATVTIRKEEMPALEAITRQIAHYAYHVGQMVYVGKMILGEEWESLSIPKKK